MDDLFAVAKKASILLWGHRGSFEKQTHTKSSCTLCDSGQGMTLCLHYQPIRTRQTENYDGDGGFQFLFWLVWSLTLGWNRITPSMNSIYSFSHRMWRRSAACLWLASRSLCPSRVTAWSDATPSRSPRATWPSTSAPTGKSCSGDGWTSCPGLGGGRSFSSTDQLWRVLRRRGRSLQLWQRKKTRDSVGQGMMAMMKMGAFKWGSVGNQKTKQTVVAKISHTHTHTLCSLCVFKVAWFVCMIPPGCPYELVSLTLSLCLTSPFSNQCWIGVVGGASSDSCLSFEQSRHTHSSVLRHHFLDFSTPTSLSFIRSYDITVASYLKYFVHKDPKVKRWEL